MRRPTIDEADINLFDFDFDLTMMIFFINADGEVYGRYGGRDSDDPDARQSLAGLRYAMNAVLDTHESNQPQTVPKRSEKPQVARDLRRFRLGRNCLHCHQVKELLNERLQRERQWTRADIWRFPPPDNLGLVLEVDRGDVVERVEPDSPAARAGLRPGDVIQTLGKFPVNSFGDAQYALDHAPQSGEIPITWRRGDQALQSPLTLPAGWRKTDIYWRRSMEWVIPSAKVFGRNLTAEERAEHGLTETQLAFWQSYPVSKSAAAAGVREGDIILGFDGKQLEMTAYKFLDHVRHNYLSGDKVKIDILRDGKRIQLPMTLP